MITYFSALVNYGRSCYDIRTEVIMVRHIVCFQMKDKTKKEEAKEMLLSMRGKVSEPLKIEVGTDFLNSERSYDVVLIVDLTDREALERYQNDPYHVTVVKPYMHAARSASVAVDYEF